MTKLEPTRTSSDLTATERLRRMLDERGVEWLDDSYAQLWCTVWDGQDGKQWRMTENQSGMLTELKAWKVTPEQAVAATLGSCNCTNDCTNSERTNVPCLPHFWTHDGALHIEATRMPTRIVVCEGGTCEFVPKRELDASEDENAKLRELVRDYEHCTMHADCSRCEYDGKLSTHCPLSPCFPDADELRELGVEVD